MNNLFSEKLKSPLVVFWELTSKCNFKCKHCYTHSSNIGSQLPENDTYSILKILCKKEVFSLGLGGGEPLLLKNLDNIIKIAHNAKMDVSLSTNGSLITPIRAKKLKDSGISLVQVSIDGMESTHDVIRGQGNFKKATNALKVLKDAGIITRLAITVNNINFREIKAVFDLALNLQVDWFIAFRYMSAGRAGCNLSMNYPAAELTGYQCTLHVIPSNRVG